MSPHKPEPDIVRHYTVPAEQRTRKDGTILDLPAMQVELVIDGDALRYLAVRAARAKGRKSRSGPAVAKARKVTR